MRQKIPVGTPRVVSDRLLERIGKRQGHNTLVNIVWKDRVRGRWERGKTKSGHSVTGGHIGVWRCDCGAETQHNMSTRIQCCMKCRGSLYPHNKPTLKHGKAATPTYICWNQLKSYAKNALARGKVIPIKKKWAEPNGFPAFLADMGERPPRHRFCMKNFKKGYMPKNCYWKPYEQ
jgi:hypothetical protein